MTAPKTDLDQTIKPEDRLIVALDVDSADKARDVIRELEGLVNTFKIGLQLFSAEGPSFVHELVDRGKRIFLDLKFHDIPTTVAKAGIEAARLGVWMFNVHAAGGSEMMRRTAAEVADFCAASNRSRPLVIGVTVLTSTDSAMMNELAIGSGVESYVARLASLAENSGLDGVVASAKEIGIVRSGTSSPGFLIVTPGIRPDNATYDDQKRVMTPGSAVSAGADHIVVGRPVLETRDRRTAVEKILDEIRKAA
jgi:orotidine-5'-phosphate decarboxylase